MKKTVQFVIALFLVSSIHAQVQVGDATLPGSVTFQSENLQLNGAGMREKFFFDIYAAGLYLKQKGSNAKSIASADETMCIKMHIVSSMMSRKKMVGALRDGFKKATNNNTKPLEDRINQFIGFIKEEIEVDQIYDIVYEKGKGSVIYKNGIEKGHIKGMDFKEALFNIWLGSKPADKGLRNSLLGL